VDITCEQCQGKFKIPDEKVPEGKAFSVTCPKCRSKIAVGARVEPSGPDEPAAPAPEPAAEKDKTVFDEVTSGSYDASEKPFDFVEEGVQTALLCEPDEALRSEIHATLDNLAYRATEPATAVDALKQMRFHVFDLIVLNEMFDTDDPDACDVLKYLDQLAMVTRRNIFVTLITDRFRTMDDMVAFNKSVNLIINSSNTDEIEKILKRGIADNDAFYRVYREAMVTTGRV